MDNTLDARGLDCPHPVILTKKALEELKEGSLVVVVDNDAARGNVCNLASSKSCGTEVEEKEGDYYITITRQENLCEIFSTQKETVIVFGSNVLGSNEDLGKVLMKSYIYTLSEGEDLPRSMIFLNSGVILTTQGSEVLDDLKGLGDRGVEILSCGTCLEFFELKEKLEVGSISNMYTITEKMAAADKVFTLG